MVARLDSSDRWESWERLTLPLQCINKIDNNYVDSVVSCLNRVIVGSCELPEMAPCSLISSHHAVKSGGFKVVFSIMETQHWIRCKEHLILSLNQSPIECGYRGTILELIVLDSFMGLSIRLLPASHFPGHGCCSLLY